MKARKSFEYMMMVGAVLILTGVVLFITRTFLSPYIYSLGAILFVIPQLMDRYEGRNLIIIRLRRQQILGAMFLLLTALLMFLLEHNEWILSLTIAAILELYTAFRIPKEIEKENMK